MPPAGARDSLSPTWSCCVFDFGSPGSEQEQHRRAIRIGVEREMQIMYQQPHLVPPMKLTVYDDLPATPAPMQLSRVATWASRASERASLSGRIRRASRRRTASAPVALEEAEAPIRRRRRSFRPLELSIYLPENRLSDLPEFDTDVVAFTDSGEISLPPRALLRTASEAVLRPDESLSPRKPTSVFQEPTYYRPSHDTASTIIIPTSRPPSEYDALHSHPVSWSSLPGLPPPCHHRDLVQSISVLSPMQEELTPVCTPACITIDGTTLEFPKPPPTPVIDGDSFTTAQEPTISSTPTPFKLSQPPAASSTRSLPLRANLQHAPENYDRISQWLGHSHSTSSLTTDTNTSADNTTRSFAEHRRKRSDFYQCRLPLTPVQVQPAHSPRVHSQSCPIHHPTHERQRTLSSSTLASTVDTTLLSLDDTNSTTSATSVPTVQTQARSRSATVKSFSKPTIVVVQEIPVKKSHADMSRVYADVEKEMASMFVPELNRPLRSPAGVGIAF